MAKKKKEEHEELDGGLFMNQESYDLEIMYGRHSLEVDSPFKIKYYKINVLTSKVHSLYAESKPADKKFFPPIILRVMFEIDEAQEKSMGGITRNDTGNLVFGVYDEELKEKNLEIIKGDYVSINISGEKERFYEISSPNYINDTTAQSTGGFKPFWRQIEAVPVKEDVIPIISNQI